MSLPSVAKEKTSNKVSLVTRPSVTLVQPVQVIGSSASQPRLIYVQSIPQQNSQPAFITTKVNKPQTFNKSATITTSKSIQKTAINKIVAIPSSSTSKQVQTFQLKVPKVVPIAKPKPVIISHTKLTTRIPLNDKQTIAKITKIGTPTPLPKLSVTTPIKQIKDNVILDQISSSILNSKTAPTNVSKPDPVKYRYRTILENLLQLKNNFVRRTITQAIREKLCNQSNEDLLNVIFKSFELTLHSVNVEQIYLNETYLNATLAFLAKVIETGRFMELIENRKETKDIRKFITSEMSTILNKVSLESVYKNAREIFEQKQRGSYAQILELLIKAISCAKTSPESRMTSTEIEFWFKEVMPLIFDSDDDIQTNAIDAVNKAVPLLLSSRLQSHPHWQRARSDILSEYTKKINNCFRQGSPKWYMVWCLCVRLLDIDIPRSASTLNAFLSIVEPALRSNIPIRRAEGYLCWRVLLEVLVRHNRLNSEKRLKLMCTPLKSLQAKTVEIATNKFHAWWYVICNVRENVDNYISMVFEPFLHFSFGPLFATPKLSLEPTETATQVKSFPDVSLMAVATFLRLLDESNTQIDELFEKFSLVQPSFTILTESIFSIQASATIIINACGEATLMLNRLRNDLNKNIDCTTLSVCLWTRLFKHVNRAKSIEHINLVLDNVSQLLQINQLNQNLTRMVPVVCSSILGHVGTSFVFEQAADGGLTEDMVKTIAQLMNTLILLPSMQSRFSQSLSKLLVTPQDTSDSERIFLHLLNEIYNQFFNNNEQIDRSSEKFVNKLTIGYEFVDCILQYIQINADTFKIKQIPQVFYKMLYWPLSLPLNRVEFDVYSKNLLNSIDLLITVIGKLEFCKESASAVKNYIAVIGHCMHINDTIAKLFEYMVYDFDELSKAPLDMLNLCELVIKKESKVVFQDMNSITEALIKYRRSIGQKQFEIIAPKLREIVQLIDDGKASFRTHLTLLKDLKELVGEEIKTDKLTCQSNKSLRSNKPSRPEDDEFVVVNKVWKLEPGKLTEHQKEKMKTRRCDIPALYNDLSMSQDSASIQAWAPKSMDLTKIENNDENKAINETNETACESPSSQRSKKNDKASKSSPKRSIQSQNDSDRETSDEAPPKRRMVRELNRIQIDAIVEEVPYNSLPESNRLTRSTVKKIEEQPQQETPMKRKTRSNSLKPADIKTPDTKDVKKKTTRASLANSPVSVPVKMKTKTNAKPVTNADTEPFGEATMKRRLTRQTKTEETEPDELVQIIENKKTEFVDTLELKVQKLPTEIQPKQLKYTEKSENEAEEFKDELKEEKKEDIQEETKQDMEKESLQSEVAKIVDNVDMDVDEPTIVEGLSSKANENNEIVNETPEQLNDKMDIDIEQNAQTLVETQTIPNGNITEISSEKQEQEQKQEQDHEMDNEVSLSSRSYMSALVFDGISPSKSLNGSTIVTSPEIAGPRSLEFLNDTLNISPIVSETDNLKKDNVPNNQAKKKLDVMDEIGQIQVLTIPVNEDHDAKTEKPGNADAVSVEKESAVMNENENDSKVIVAQKPIPESPIVSTSSKQLKTALTVQSSTPIQSHHSPVSSKFKTQLMGRGAQLLKMINKSPKPASPTPPTMIESAFINMTKITASPTINQLETATIFENVVSTPEPKTSKEKLIEQNENGNFLTLSGVLPSPYESPGISILKRKSSNISMDDSMHSPAAKRKRVSFGFPLSQTKEYIIDEEFTPYYMLPSNESPGRRTNRLKKLRLKRNKNPNDHAKTLPSQNKTPHMNESNPTNELVSNVMDEEVSVKHIQKYLGMDAESYRAKQETCPDDANTSATPAANANHLNSDDSSTESNDDEPEIEPAILPATQALNEFSDDVLFAHLLSKHSPNDILKKFESIFDTKVLTKRLSSIMSTNKQTENEVLEELAEKHSESFLEHAITENLCSVICDRLSVKSSNGITDYATEKINSDDQFASDFLDRVSVSLLRQKLMDAAATSKREQHILLDDFLTALKDYINSTHRVSPKTIDTGILPEHIHLWVSKLFDQFKLTPEQYLQLTSIYIQRNPPPTLDSFD